MGLPMRAWCHTGGGMQLYPWSPALPWFTQQVNMQRANIPRVFKPMGVNPTGSGLRKKKRRYRKKR